MLLSFVFALSLRSMAIILAQKNELSSIISIIFLFHNAIIYTFVPDGLLCAGIPYETKIIKYNSDRLEYILLCIKLNMEIIPNKLQ